MCYVSELEVYVNDCYMTCDFTAANKIYMNSILAITKRKKSPDQIVKLASKALADVTNDSLSADERASQSDELCKRLAQMKTILYGEGDNLEIEEEKAIELSRYIQQVNDSIFGSFAITKPEYPGRINCPAYL